MDINGTPLIYTSKGNVSIDSLQTRITWDFSDDGQTTTIVQEWQDKTQDGEWDVNAEVVKRAVHIHSKRALVPAIGAEQAKLPG